MGHSRISLLTAGILLAAVFVSGAEPARKALSRHVPRGVAHLTPKGRWAAANPISIAIGLPLRNPASLDEFLRQLQDPQSPNFHKYLTPSEFTVRFGPTESEYAAVVAFAETNGLRVIGTHPNRAVLDVEGAAPAVGRAFGVTLQAYRHPSEGRDFYAPDTEPTVPANLPVAFVEGLSDYSLPRPLSLKTDLSKVRPLGGSGPGGYYAGNDFRNAYVPGSPLTGAGQTVGLLQFSDYYKSDITNYQRMIGMTNFVPLTNVVLPGGTPATTFNEEVALDIEMAIAMAPQLSRVIVYEIKSVNPSTILNRMATDNLAKQLSSSWGWSGGPSTSVDNALKQMAAQGQSFFQASGDSDAYTGSQVLSDPSQVNSPMDSTNLTCVGGTTLSMAGSGSAYSSETVWNYNRYGGTFANIGSGGGVSGYYLIPDWQTNVNPAAAQGSATYRNIPDVALTADGITVCYTSGSTPVTNALAGTSCAAPLWAGYCALINQQSLATAGTSVGFLNPALYRLAATTNYAKCFHDITTGNNVGTNTPGFYNATNGYDLTTGLGTPNGMGLINALAPLPGFIAQPAGATVASGTAVTLSATVVGASPLSFQWRLNGTNVSSGGNLSGTTTSALTISAATTNNSGNYSLLIANGYGSITSSIAILNVGAAPLITRSPTNLTLLAGASAVFSVAATGSTPLAYQWRSNGTNAAGSNLSGTNTATLTLSSITTNNAANYSVTITNAYGAITSSVATLTVVLPPTISSSSLTNRTVECSSNLTYSITANGTAPLDIQWSLDGSPLPGATNSSLTLTNVLSPNHLVAVMVTNLYASTTSNAALTILDTRAPTVTLTGSSLMTSELGAAFIDPGATATDACAGSVAVTVTGSVNTAATGTNTLTYRADDGSGNTNTALRTVVVRDTTPPVIVWSFTNRVQAANENCSGLMTNLTGTNGVIATDLSGPVTVTQSPTNGAVLALGTNLVIFTVRDGSSNAAFSTNRILVQDLTPPVIVSPPQSRTNSVGDTAVFSVAATACTPLTYQWFFNNTALAPSGAPTLTLSNVTVTLAGNYSAVITGSGGSSTSVVAVLTVKRLGSSVALSSSANPSGYRDLLSFTATLLPTNASGTVQFYTNLAAFDTQLLTAGNAVSAKLNSLPRGTNPITVVYSGDDTYQSATNSLLQIVTNHPPSAAPAAYSRDPGAPLNIPVADLALGWTDVDGDPLSLADFSVSTNGVTLTNNAGVLLYVNTNDVADQFQCGVSDGWGGAAVQTVTLSLTPPVISIPNIVGPGGSGSGGFTLSLSGAPGYTYVLESTTDLVPGVWLSMATNTLGTNGVWIYTDTSVTNTDQKFYRLKLVQ